MEEELRFVRLVVGGIEVLLECRTQVDARFLIRELAHRLAEPEGLSLVGF